MKRRLLNSSLGLAALLAAACAAHRPSTTVEVAPAAKHEAVSEPRLAMVDSRSGSATIVPREAREPQASQRSPVAAIAAPSRGTDDAQVIATLIDLARRDNHVQDHLRHLCLAIGPRLTSSHNLAKAQEWALEQFRSWGLEAKLEQWGEFPVGFDRGAFRGNIVGDPTPFEFTTSSWTAGTKGPTRGRVVFKPETLDQLAEVKDQLSGAWLVLRVYEESADRPKPDKEEREAVAAAIEAAGIAGEIRSSGRDLVLTGGNQRVAWDKLPTAVRVSLRGSQYKDLVARVSGGETVEVEFDIDNRFYEGPVPQYNVIADIVGSEHPDEYVIVGGHLDSWDGAQGAVDNGTGSATTLEVARLLMAAGARPKRTIRFALWSGEEQGLFGSTGYVRDHADELDRISAVYIHDGGTNYLSGLGVTYEMEPQMRQICAPLFDLNPELPFKLRVTDGFQFSADSDHAPFAQKSVPGFFWDQDGKSDYNHMHHTQYDTFDTAVPEYQEHSALVAAIAAYNTANLPSLLDRGNFKAGEPRRMGVNLNGAKLGTVNKGGKAEAAGWKVGDIVQSIDGVAVTKQSEVTNELQKGGPRKVFVLLRGTETIETVLDYSDDPEEAARAERRAMREARKQAAAKKFW
ncbi:MAG TPA: M20/M25/M40 family metallo-hydrolase [Planctomycetota bacterium]|nr:M20/M25/M40 family metallo-hydrolase [Planctomycetota bacterium]